MCPDPQILSIYLDGELPSPWKEKMEAHLAACPKCKEKLENYKHVHDLLDESNSIIPLENEVLEKSKEKIWKEIASKPHYSQTGLVRKSGNVHGFNVWKQKLSVPIPVAIAAALLIVFGIAFLARNSNSANLDNQITEFTNLIEEMPYDFLPTSASNDINSVLQYLDTSGADIIILQLPESRNFSRSGEPAIIRAADYSRAGNAPRRQP